MNRRSFIRDAAAGLFVLGAPNVVRSAQLPFRRNAFRAFVPIALVANVTKQGTSSGSGDSAAVDTTGANKLVVIVADLDGATTTLSDNKGNTWILVRSDTTVGGARTSLYYVQNPTVGSGHTFAANGTGSYASLAMMAFSNTATASSLDQQNGATGGLGITSLQPGSVTPSENNELLVCGLNPNTGTGPTINSGFTRVDFLDINAGVSFGIASAYLVQTTVAAVNPTWSWTGAANLPSCSIATFKHA